MKLALLCIAGTGVLVLGCLWMMSRISYRVGRRHVRVLLFGIPLRRIRIDQIAYASKHEPNAWAERWYNTLRISHRLLTIEKRRGLIKNICITPRHRYAFLGEIKSAVRRIDPEAEWAQVTSFEESTAIVTQANDPEPKD